MFKLVIECSKDIDKLSIDFSDGTCITTSKPNVKNQKNTSDSDTNDTHMNNFIDTSKNYSNDCKESIKALEIPDINDRPAKIDDNLNNLDF